MSDASTKETRRDVLLPLPLDASFHSSTSFFSRLVWSSLCSGPSFSTETFTLYFSSPLRPSPQDTVSRQALSLRNSFDSSLPQRPASPPTRKGQTMPTTPFPTLLAHLLALNPNHSDPFSLYGPLLCSVLSRLNEPELILVLFDDLCERLESVGDGRIPDWIRLIGKDTRDGLSEKSMAKLVVAVRIREALLKVSSTSPSFSLPLPFPIVPSGCFRVLGSFN